MRSFRNYIVLSVLFFQLPAFGQGNIQEEVLLVTNKDQFLTGENIYFQGFVTSSKTGKLSGLSSLLYIELFDENQNPIYQTKLTLEQGLIVVRYSDFQEQGISFKGKLVDDLGEKQADINSVDGLAQFSFIPEKERLYQMIYTEGDVFKFLDLPVACENCSSISMQEMPNAYIFQLIDNHAKSQLNRASIRVRDRHNIYIEERSERRGPFKIEKTFLPNKLLKVEILDNQGVIMAERLFYNGVFRLF